MTVTLTDPLIGKPRFTAEDAFAYAKAHNAKRLDFLSDYLQELWRLGELTGLDPSLLCAQSLHECTDPVTGDAWSSYWYVTRGNMAGIGITGDPEQNNASQTWANGTDAARGHIVHMYGYTIDTGAPSIKRFGVLTPYMGIYAQDADLDVRYSAIQQAGLTGSVHVLGDLGNGRWAADPDYARLIAARANDMLRSIKEESPVPTTTPTTYNLSIDYERFGLTGAQAAAVLNNKFPGRLNQGVQGKPTFIVLHIQVGNTTGSLESWTERDASSTVMIQRDGSILRVIPEGDAPWTNGDDRQPTATGQRLVALPGNSNLWTVSIEAEGNAGTDVLDHPAQLDAIEWQVRQWMTAYAIPIENVIRHGDVNTIDKANCPGAYYPEIIRRLKATPPTPEKPKPAPIWWDRDDIGLQVNGNGDRALAMLAETHTRGEKEATLYSVAVAQKKYAIGTVKPNTVLTLRGTTRQKSGRGFGFVEVPGSPGQVARITLSNLVEKWPTL